MRKRQTHTALRPTIAKAFQESLAEFDSLYQSLSHERKLRAAKRMAKDRKKPGKR